MKKTTLYITITASALILATNSYAGDKNNGASIYTKNCAGCHGKTGEGNGPAASTLMPKPSNFVLSSYKDSTGKSVKDYTASELSKIIEYGRKGTAMPQWRKLLSDKDIEDVLAYIQSLKQNN